MERNNETRFRILSFVKHNPATISQLSDLIHVSRPAIYKNLEVLEKKGLVRRKQDKSKKGAPVTIYPKLKELKQFETRRIVEFLKMFEKKEVLEHKEYLENLKTFNPGSFLLSTSFEAEMMGYIDKNIFITSKGKVFLKEHSDPVKEMVEKKIKGEKKHEKK